MTNWLKIALLAAVAAGLPMVEPGVAQAQQARGNDPNMGHFYMARQQITITDDAPLVNNKMTQPGAPGAAAGGLPNGIPQGLPAARWTQYSPAENPNLSTSLPKVQNGVPPKMPPAGPNGLKGKTGKLTGKPAAPKVAAQAPAQPTTQGYAPYKKFAPDGIVGGEGGANSNVKGDVLHWARRGH